MQNNATPNKAPKPNALNTARKFTVRVSLATGSVMATLFGAQSLLLIDHRPPTSTPASVLQQASTPFTNVATDSSKPPAPPQVVIMRNAGSGSSAVNVQPANMKPPVPVIAPPVPQVINQGQPGIQAAPVQPAPASQSSR